MRVGPRGDTTLEALDRLKPVFTPDGTVTAGNSSSLNDGAAAVLLAAEPILDRYGLVPLTRLVTSAVAGVEPHRMGIGPVPALDKALTRAGWKLDDLETVELNEAFTPPRAWPSSASLASIPNGSNPSGGAIALGRPLGCSGARLLTTLAHGLRSRPPGARAAATMCIGVGQGIACPVGLTSGGRRTRSRSPRALRDLRLRWISVLLSSVARTSSDPGHDDLGGEMDGQAALFRSGTLLAQAGERKSVVVGHEASPLWHRLLLGVEQPVGRYLEQAVGTERFADAVATLIRLRVGLRGRFDQATGRNLRFWNLPAASQVEQLSVRLAAVEHHVRELGTESDGPSSVQRRS